MPDPLDPASLALSPATLRAYRGDWEHFRDWCYGAKLSPLPASPETLAAYLAALAATHGRATVRRRLPGIGHHHRIKGQPWPGAHPLIRATLRGVFRRHGKPQRKAAALGTAEITRLLATCEDDLTGTRDRALFLLGFAGALRRSELVSVRWDHLTFAADSARLMLPRAKTDQTGEGVEIGIPKGKKVATCPVRALLAWRRLCGDEGPVFRKINVHGGIEDRALHPGSVGLILKRRARAMGLRVGPNERLSAHGLRAGHITQAYGNGVLEEVIMRHSRHKDFRSMRGYVRRAKLVSQSSAARLGL